MPSHKSFKLKSKIARYEKTHRRMPPWFRLKKEVKKGYNYKMSRHGAKHKIKI